MSDYLRHHGLQHSRLPCPPPTPGARSNSCPLSLWCHPAISSSSSPLLLPSTFPHIRVFSNESALCIRWPKYRSFSFNISPSSEYSGLIFFKKTGLISLLSKGLLRIFSSTMVQNHQFFHSQPSFLEKEMASHSSILACRIQWTEEPGGPYKLGSKESDNTERLTHTNSTFFMVQRSHSYMTTGKIIALTRWTFVSKVMYLLFNMLSRLVIAFLPRSKHLLILWLQSPAALILEPKKIKSLTVSIVSPSICPEVMGSDAMILVFWMLSFKPTFSLSSFTFIKRLFSSSLSAIGVVSSAYLRLYRYFSRQSWFQLMLHPDLQFA